MLTQVAYAASCFAGTATHSYLAARKGSNVATNTIKAILPRFLTSYGALTVFNKTVTPLTFRLVNRIAPNNSYATGAVKASVVVVAFASPWIVAQLTKGWNKAVDFAASIKLPGSGSKGSSTESV